MSNVANPYQPPQEDEARIGSEPGTGDFRVLNGDTLVAEKGAVLPAICLWNGEPCSGDRRETNFAWAPSWTLIFIVSPLLYVLVYLLVRKRGRLSYCLGTEARARRKQSLMLVLGALLAGVVLGTIGVARDLDVLIAVAWIGGLLSLLVALLRAPTLRATRIDERHVHIKLKPSAAAAFSRVRAS
jgi:hypothetical protein